MSKPTRTRRPLIEAIEPRLLFSATADIAVFDDGSHYVDALTHAANNLDLTQVYPDLMAQPPLSAAAATEAETADTPIALPSDAPTEIATHSLVFVDTSVKNYQTLVQDILNNPDNKNIELIYLHSDQDAIQQITDVLHTYTNVSAIHLISHGDDGIIEVGQQVITENTINDYAAQLHSWKSALTDNADILLYGCSISANAAGLHLLNEIHQLTGADVAASKDITGNKNAGGNWVLESHVGAIEHASLIQNPQDTGWQETLATTVYETSGSTSSTMILSPGQSLHQSFTHTSGSGTYSVNTIGMYLDKNAFAQSQNITVTLSSALGSGVLATASISSASLSTSLTWESFHFGNVTLNDGQTYYINISTNGSDGLINMGVHSSNMYAGGTFFYDSLTPDANRDFAFQVSSVTGNFVPTVANPLVSQTATRGSAFSYTFASNSFNDANGDTLTYTAKQQLGQALPTWLTFDANTRTFSGTPTAITDVQPITIRVTASDGNGGTTYDEFVLTVSNRIQAENYNQTSGTSIEATSDTGGGSDLTSIDPNDWAAFFGNVVNYSGTYNIDWRVASATGGSIKLEPYGGGSVYDTIVIPNTGGGQNWVTVSRVVTFTDIITSNYGFAGVTGSNSINWFELTPIDKPTVSRGLADQLVALNTPFNYQFSNTAGSNIFESNDTLTYTATLSDGSALPSWLSFNAATRTFSGTQTNSDLGDLNVRVTATDTRGASVYDDFAIFDAVNNAPVNTVPGSQTINEDGSITFNQGAGITGTYYNNKTLTGPAAGTRTDTDIHFVWPNSPSIGGIGNDAFSTRWDGQIHITETGDFQFRTQSDDGVRVYIDGQLVIDNWRNHGVETNTTGNIAFTAGKTYSVVVEYYESTGSAQIDLSWTTPSSGVFTTVPSGNVSTGQQGLYIGNSIAISDIDSGSGNIQVSLSVAHGTLTLPHTSGLTFSTGDGTADAAMVFYGTKSNVNSALAFLKYIPTANFNGTDSLSMTTSDLGNAGSGGAKTDTDIIGITVNSVNDNPTGTDKTITTNEDAPYTFTVSDFGFNDGDVGDTFSEVRIDSLPAAGTLKLSGVNVLAGDVISSANIGNLVFTPAANANGSNYANFTFSVRDQTNLFNTTPNTITLNVTAVNDAPTVANPIPDRNITVGTGLNFQFSNTAFNDVDPDTLTYTAQLTGGGSLPSWLSFNAATRTFSGIPHNSDAGTINIDVTANDGNGGTVTDTFAITTSTTADISYVNTNANGFELVPTNTQSIGQTFTFNSGNGSYVVNELNLFIIAYGGAPQTVTVKIMDAPGGNVLGTSSVASTDLNPSSKEWHSFNFSDLVLNDNTTYYFEVSSNSNDGAIKLGHWGNVYAGGTAFVNGVADASKDLCFQLHYENGSNTAPTLDNAISDKAINTEAGFNYTIPANTFSDVDALDIITYRAHLVGQPTGLDWITFNTATRTFGGTPHFNHIGTWHVQVDAYDNHGATVSEFFDVVVANANTVPTPIPDQPVLEGSAYSFQFTAFNNANGHTLTYSATQADGSPLPAWLNFNAATRTFSGTADDGDVSVKSIKVTANDGFGGSVSDTFTLTVSNVQEAPTILNPIADQNATGYVPFSFSFGANVASDPDIGDSITYTAQLNGGGALPSWLSYNSTTRTFSGTPTNADVGTLTIDVIATDSASNTATDTFNLVIATGNTPPVNTVPGAQSTNEDTPLIFSAGNSNQIQITDVDAGGNSVQVTLGVAHGGLSLASLTGLSFITGDGTSDASMVFTGTVININAALATLTYTPTANYFGADTLNITTNDLGNTGAGGAHSDADSVAITVASVNDAPIVANAITDQNATEDSAFSFQFASNTFSDIEGNSLTYSATLNGGGALPSWLSFNAATRTFSGTPTNADVGTLTIDVIANDGNGGNGTETFAIVIANTNDAPTIANAILDQNATEDSAFNFQFASNTFNDVDVSDTLTYTTQLNGGGALPTWLNFNAATRTFSGTPTNADVGTLTIDVTASDGNGGTITDTFALVIANTNDAPTIANAIPDQNATEDSAFNFQFASNTFADVDAGYSLTYSSTLNGGGALPSWLSFNAATRTFSGTPTNADVGTLTIDVIANDGNGGTVTDTFTIVIANTNDAPTIANAIPDKNATEDSAFNFQFSSNTFNDADVSDTLTYTTQLNGGGALPSWLSFNAATRTFSGTPTNADVGTLTIDVTASDGNGGTITDTFALVIANTNDAPTIANAIPDQNATEDSAFNFQFASNTFADVDLGDTLTYTTQLNGGGALPTWLSFNATTRTFSGTPTNADVGILTIDVIANDGNGGTITDTFALVIANTNDAPTIANAIPDQNATEDSAFNFQFALNTFADVDLGDTLTYTTQLNGGGALPSWLSFNTATRTFSGTPTNADVGTLTIDVTASDGNGGTITDTFALIIANTNDAPTIANAIPDQNATEDSAFNFQFASNTFTDADIGDTLTYITQLNGGGALPSWLSFNAATRTFSGTPTNADVGTLTIDVTASDGNGGTITDTFALVIANINDAPTIANAIPDQNATEDSAFNFQFASNTFTDVDAGYSLTYSSTLNGGGALPSWLSFNAATRTFSGTPTNADVGTLTIDVIANDGNGGTVTDTFAIVIANTNDAPTIANAIPDQNATEDSAFNFQFASNTFADADVADTLTYTTQLNGGSALPTWLSFNAATRTFSGTPTNADVGTLTIDVTASDGNGGTITDTFALIIANTNDAPTIANAIPDQNATEDSAFNFQFALNTFADADIGDTLTYTTQLNGGGALPSWLSFNAATRTFSGTPTNADVGTLTIDVTASDGNGGTITDTFALIIANTNDAPTIANAIPDQNATEDSAFNFQFALNTFADVDLGDTLTYTTQLNGGGALPSWLSFNATTRTFSGTPSNADVGTLTIDVTANDSNGGIVTDTFTLVITNANDAPTIANAIPDQNATEDSAFNFQFALNTFADVDTGDALTYTATVNGGGALPTWLSFNAATRTFSGTPTNTDVGTLTIDVTANDGNGGTATDTFALVIANTNDAPVIANAIPDQNATEDSAFNFQFASNAFADADVGDTLTYTTQLNGGGALPSWLSFNATTRTFSGTPSNADVGTLIIDVTANDSNGGVVTDTFTLVITNANDAPTIVNAIPDQNATEDSAFNFQFASNTFTDADVGDTLTYTTQLNGGGALPSWLSFNAATRTFSGTPTNADVGTLTIDVTASDGNGGTITDTFALIIANTNDAPTIANAIPNQNSTEDSVFNFQFASNTFADVDVADTLTYTTQLNGGGALPSWLSFNATTRTFSGTPTNADVGTLIIDVTANDGNGGVVTDSFTLVITNANDAPTIANAIPDQNATEDSAFNFQFASNTFADVDASDTLTYTATVNGGGALPSWLSFNAATRTFSGTPANVDVGTLTINVAANDGHGGVVTDSFDILITNTNDAPIVANPIAAQRATEESLFNFQIPGNTFNDPDIGDSLTYATQLTGGSALPAWLSFDSATRTFSGTPATADVSTLTIEIIATDNYGQSVTTSFILDVVNMNKAPTTTGIATVNTLENSAGDVIDLFAAFADREDADAQLIYSIVGNTNSTLVTQTTIDAQTGKLQLHYGQNQFGTSQITVRATDSGGASVDTSFTVNVAFVNQIPTSIGINNIQVIQGSAPSSINLSTIFNDIEDGRNLQYSIVNNSNPALLADIQINQQNQTSNIIYNFNAVGETTITLRATDANGGFVDSTFKVTVIAQTTPPPPIEPKPETPPPVKPGPNTDNGGKEPTKPVPDPEVNLPIGGGKNPEPNGNATDNTLANNLIGGNSNSADITLPVQASEVDDSFDPNRYERIAQQDLTNKKINEPLGSRTLISSLILPGEGFSTTDAAEFNAKLRKVHQEMEIAIAEEQQQKALLTGLTLSLTTGILIWSLRASSLLLALMSMLPLWRGIDPLPILEEVEKRKKDIEKQRDDRKAEDKNAKEVGYLFDGNKDTKDNG